MKDNAEREGKQASWAMGLRLREFVALLLEELDEKLDKRLVRSFEKAVGTPYKTRG